MEVVFHKVPVEFMINFYGVNGPAIRNKIAGINYENLGVINLDVSSDDPEDIAEELFDLTNNPGRQDEREERYGRGPSLSVGDMVEILETGKCVVCMPSGWEVL